MKKFNLKSAVAGFVAGVLCVSATAAFALTGKKTVEVNYDVNDVTINNELFHFPATQKPFLLDGSMYVPLRFFAERLGFEVQYDQSTGNVNVSGEDVQNLTVINSLLMKSMQNVGVATYQKAAEAWILGVLNRSAAMQYSVMTEQLKQRYADELSRGRSNWVTGVSSPWIDSYSLQYTKVDDETYTCEINFDTITSVPDEHFPFRVTLTIVKDGDFWRISEVDGDDDSKAYTGFAHRATTPVLRGTALD